MSDKPELTDLGRRDFINKSAAAAAAVAVTPGVTLFNLAEATINGHFDRLRSLFQRPMTPLGWKRVVEEMPTEQASGPAPRQAARPGTVWQ